MSSLASHIREIAEESGVDLDAHVQTQHSIRTHKGHAIHLYYQEDACHWEAWVKGVGTSIGYSDDEAVASAKARIDAAIA